MQFNLIFFCLLGTVRSRELFCPPGDDHDCANKITVHIVAHTHNDVGWLKTVDQYFDGTRNNIQYANVRLILDSVVRALWDDERRKFTYVEQAFFQRWYAEQKPIWKRRAKQLVNEGRLVFVNGGWCMHDEATPHYLDMIDQTTAGHQHLRHFMNYVPRVAWQLDPFGHSATQASLLSAQAGMPSLMFGRLDNSDRDHRHATKTSEFIWDASSEFKGDTAVWCSLTGSFGGNYGPPSDDFLFEQRNGRDSIQNSTSCPDYNAKHFVDLFVNSAMAQANKTVGMHIMFNFGTDFTHENAFESFRNYDILIDLVNKDGRVKAKYSDPKTFMEAINHQAIEKKVAYTTKKDDFFPYADGEHKYWTGYFTSRPALKRYVREFSSWFQFAKHIDAIVYATHNENSGLGSGNWIKQNPRAMLWDAMGILQHHDAVSGTSQQHVAFDYAQRLSKARAEAQNAFLQSMENSAQASGLYECAAKNVSVCASADAMANGTRVSTLVWNSLGWDREELVELPVHSKNVTIMTADGAPVPVTVVRALPAVGSYGGVLENAAKYTASFTAKVKPMGHELYTVATYPDTKFSLRAPIPVTGLTLENDFLRVEFKNGGLWGIRNKVSGVYIRITQEFLYYKSSVGDDNSGQPSGAYIFRPQMREGEDPAKPFLTASHLEKVSEIEVRQHFKGHELNEQSFKLVGKHVEVTWTVGGIDVSDGIGKEVVTRFRTDIDNKNVCYTDSNGRQMQKRVKNFRDTWNLQQSEEIAGNYFPVNTAMFIKDGSSQLTLLVDRTHGGTGVLGSGEMELMLHRRTLRDDWRGVGEPLSETATVGDHPHAEGLVVRGTTYLVVDSPGQAAINWRILADRVYMPLHLLFTHSPVGIVSRSALNKALPYNIQIISLERYYELDDGVDGTHKNEYEKPRLLLRLGRQFTLSEENTWYSKSAEVQLSKLFTPEIGWEVVYAEEVSLTANESHDDMLSYRQKMAWAAKTKPKQWKWPAAVGLDYLQIRTFILDIKPNMHPKVTNLRCKFC